MLGDEKRPSLGNTEASRILDAVCKHFGVGELDLRGRDRHKSVTYARHVFMYLCRGILQMSYPEIGRMLGRDHATVMHGVRKIGREKGPATHVQAITTALGRRGEPACE